MLVSKGPSSGKTTVPSCRPLPVTLVSAQQTGHSVWLKPGVHGHWCLGVVGRGFPSTPLMDHYDGRMKRKNGEGIPPSPFMISGPSFGLSNSPTTGGPHRVCVRIAEGVSNTTACRTTSAGLCIQAEKPVGHLNLSLLSPFSFSATIALIQSLVSSSTKWCVLRTLVFSHGSQESRFIQPLFLFLKLMRSRDSVAAFIFLRRYIAFFLCKQYTCLELFGDQY